MNEMYPDASPSGADDRAPRRSTSAAGTARVVLLGDDDEAHVEIERALRAALPTMRIETLPADVVIRSAGAHCVVLDRRVGGRTAAEVLRALRAGGYVGGVVLLVGEDDAGDTAAAQRFGAAGPVRWTGTTGAVALGAAVRQALHEGDDADPDRREARRTRQLIAAGELALGLQHAISNPLTALLAEAQLLELELDDEEQRAAVGRIVELCRRTIAVARQLDDVGPLA